MRRRSKRLCWGNVYWGYKWTVFYIICPLWCKILALVFPLKLRQEQLSHWTLISECALELQQPPAWVTITFGTPGLASQELSLTSAKLAAAVLVLSGFEIFNIFPFTFSFFQKVMANWTVEQLDQIIRPQGDRMCCTWCARTSPSSPASTLLPLSGEQHSCNEAESGGDADQVELDGETGYGQQARTSCPGAGFIQGRRKIWRRRRTVPCQTGRYAPLFFISH